MLDGFFKPRAVAIIGASREEGKVGFSIVDNMVKGKYAGPIYPVNPKATEILGLPCFPDVAKVPEGVELAVLVTPPKACLPTLEACAAKGIKSAIVISAGFKEVGGE